MLGRRNYIQVSPFDIEIPVAKLKRYKSPGSNKFPTELIQAGAKTLKSEIHKLIHPVCIKTKVSQQWKESLMLPVHRKVTSINVAAQILVAHDCCQLHTKFYLISFSQG
jgi:hypothetical protein